MTVLAGCGTSEANRQSSAVAAREIRVVVASFKHALQAGDLPLSCNYLSPASQHAVVVEAKRSMPSATACAQVMRRVDAFGRRVIAETADKLSVKDVRVSGDHATVVTLFGKKSVVSGAVREAGVWKLIAGPP
jgi:ketosteroid isomerase-like protein